MKAINQWRQGQSVAVAICYFHVIYIARERCQRRRGGVRRGSDPGRHGRRAARRRRRAVHRCAPTGRLRFARATRDRAGHGSGSSVGGGGGGCDGRAAAAAAAVALEVKRVDVKRKEPAFCSFFLSLLVCLCKPQTPPSVCPLPPDCGADEYPPVRSLYVGRHIETPLVEC